MLKHFTEKLKELLNNPLPAMEAHKKMAPQIRLSSLLKKEPQNARKSAVLILFYQKDNELYFPLIKRTDYGGIHGAQYSFPGGKFETNDNTLENTALRETFEEIGLQVNPNNIIGKLSTLYIPVSNFSVYPVIATIDYSPLFVIDTKEVEFVAEIPLLKFLDDKAIQMREIKSEFLTFSAPFFVVDNHAIWGATAMILSELKEIIKNIQPSF